MITVKRALLSVSDKGGIVEFARGLAELGVEIVSSGGTARVLAEAGVPVRRVEEVTGFPEILDGRVKTLHPAIHAGILARRDVPEHLAKLEELGIRPIDLVAVNLYPFAATIARPDVTLEEAVENIDIGGPTLIRAAAKNHRGVVVVVNPLHYEEILKELREKGGVSFDTAYRLAAEAFAHTAQYDSVIAAYLAGRSEAFPACLPLTYTKVRDLRYGENPHQRAALYARPGAEEGIPFARQLHGKELSFNNIADANAAWELVQEFSAPCAVGVKHMNPCGVGIGPDLLQAWRKAYAGDPVSIFGGIVAFNREVTADLAAALNEIFLEVVIAPGFSDEALTILKEKKNRILLEAKRGRAQPGWDLRTVRGGLLVQELDVRDYDPADLKVVTRRAPTEKEMADLAFAWKVVKYVKSNAIVLARDGGTVGVGAGQMNRVGAVEIAVRQAGEKARGAVLASDAFFPMPDSVEAAARAGVTAIIQPGGSVRDADSIRAADEAGIAMVFTGIRHFRH
ncbi:MAG: phosphoribosylaminoimidazolecarboxamide formyltransferase / cyclohydrolase [Bacillota bacterium]|jgi:phosphoribosylaminoimidazolecarboxamide formyltransferase/IMP cyclohydrolase|nr:phosphoribosylaminoimidazolecarboxamide formyltransferase / cyclohydrolase [Bacillota bacterium]